MKFIKRITIKSNDSIPEEYYKEYYKEYYLCPLCDTPSYSIPGRGQLDCSNCELWIDLDDFDDPVKITYNYVSYTTQEFAHMLKLKAFL